MKSLNWRIAYNHTQYIFSLFPENFFYPKYVSMLTFYSRSLNGGHNHHSSFPKVIFTIKRSLFHNRESFIVNARKLSCFPHPSPILLPLFSIRCPFFLLHLFVHFTCYGLYQRMKETGGKVGIYEFCCQLFQEDEMGVGEVVDWNQCSNWHSSYYLRN